MRCTVTSPSIKYFQYFGFLGLVIGTSSFAPYTLLPNLPWLMDNGMATLPESQFELFVLLIMPLHWWWDHRPSKVL